MLTATRYYSEEIKAADEIEKEEKRNLLINAVNGNEGMIDDNRITINDWYVDDELDNKNVKRSDNAKVYLDDLIKKTIESKIMDISFVKTMTAMQDSVDEKLPSPPYDAKHHTLDEILEPPQPSNADARKKEENETEEHMQTK